MRLTPGATRRTLVTSDAEGPDRVKLLKFVVDFGCGGTERQFVNLGLALDPGRVDLHFACMRRQGRFLSDLERRRLPVAEYPISTLLSARCVAQQVRLARYVMRHGLHIVHAYNFYGNVFALPAARLARTPVVIASIRDRGVYLSPRQAAWQRQICRMADCVLVNADAIKSWLVEQGYPAGRIVVIRNGINLAAFATDGPGADLRRDLGVPSDTPLIGVVGRVSPKKGIESLIDAAAILPNRHARARVVVIGEAAADGAPPDRDYVATLKAQARRAGLADRILFTGYRGDVPSLLPQLSVSVQPSLSEGLSNTILESMAAGAPIVATRVGGTPEAVEDGRTGLLVPPADPRRLSAAIARLLDDARLAADLAAAGRDRVETHFSLARMVRATEELYEDLLEKKGLGRRARAAAAAGSTR